MWLNIISYLSIWFHPQKMCEITVSQLFILNWKVESVISSIFRRWDQIDNTFGVSEEVFPLWKSAIWYRKKRCYWQDKQHSKPGTISSIEAKKKLCTQIIPHRAADSAIFASVCLLCINFALLLHTIYSCERKCKELVTEWVAKSLPSFFLQILHQRR